MNISELMELLEDQKTIFGDVDVAVAYSDDEDNVTVFKDINFVCDPTNTLYIRNV